MSWLNKEKKLDFCVTLNRNPIILWFYIEHVSKLWQADERKEMLYLQSYSELPKYNQKLCVCVLRGAKKEVYASMPHGHLMTLSLGSFFCSPDVSIRRDHDCSLHAESSWNKRGLMSSIQITAKFFLTQDA